MKKKTLFADILESVTKYFVFLVIAVVLFILCSGIRVVPSGNKAIVLRFGKLVGDTYEEQVHGPGLLFAFPYIIDEVIIVPTDSVIEQKVTTYYSDNESASGPDSRYLITGDQNIIVLSASVKYHIEDPVKYALNVNDIPSLINACVSTALLNEAAGMEVDALLTNGKDEYNKKVISFTEQKLEEAGVGVGVRTLELTKVTMPQEVRTIYDKVNSTAVDAATVVEQARQYREKLIPQAQSEADTMVSEANSAYSESIAAANTDLAEFWGVLEEYKANPADVYTRIYTQKVTEFMNKIGTVRVVEDGDTKIFLNP